MIAISKSSLDATAQIWIEIVECFGRSVDSVRSAMLRVTTLKCNRCCTPPILLSPYFICRGILSEHTEIVVFGFETNGAYLTSIAMCFMATPSGNYIHDIA